MTQISLEVLSKQIFLFIRRKPLLSNHISDFSKTMPLAATHLPLAVHPCCFGLQHMLANSMELPSLLVFTWKKNCFHLPKFTNHSLAFNFSVLQVRLQLSQWLHCIVKLVCRCLQHQRLPLPRKHPVLSVLCLSLLPSKVVLQRTLSAAPRALQLILHSKPSLAAGNSLGQYLADDKQWLKFGLILELC